MLKLSDFLTVADARSYGYVNTVPVNDAINHDAVHNVEPILDATLSNQSAPDNVKCACRVFKKIINGVLPDINIGDQVTQDALALMVSSTECGYTQEMRDHIESLATVRPYENVSTHIWMLSRGECPIAAVSQFNGWAAMTISSDCEEEYQPRLMGKSPSGSWHRISNFGTVKLAGNYECKVPAGWLTSELAVDNPYSKVG